MAKILIVGDDRCTRDAVSHALSGSHFQILTAADERDALFQFGTARPDLIILDTNGWESLRQIREMSRVPIIALGRADDPEAAVKSLNCGADYFLGKPFGSQELCARIRALLRRAKSRLPF